MRRRTATGVVSAIAMALVCASTLAQTPASASVPAPPAPPKAVAADEGPALGAPAPEVVTAAREAPLVRYHRDLPGGAYTNAGNSGGASVILAFAAYAGDRSADRRLLEQMRYTLTGGNDIAANGGYPAQHELLVTGMFAVAKRTPRIWHQLSAVERQRVDALMLASLVGSAFTTSDNNPFVLAGQPEQTLDGDGNLGRGWNPNYREGMGGSILVAASYFGVPTAQQLLRTYQHEAFVHRLDVLGLDNAHRTFTWKASHPDSAAPTGAQIESAVHDWSLWGVGLDEPMRIEADLALHTYGATVECGLNGGEGILTPDGIYAGVIDSGCDGLPNLGAPGMLLEFDSVDANGPRSSAVYAYGGYKPNQITQSVMIASGLWQATPDVDEIIDRMLVGIEDLWYKLAHGYREYSRGEYRGIMRIDNPGYGFVFLRSLWEDVVAPYHGVNSP
jgi:hypothetical protein